MNRNKTSGSERIVLEMQLDFADFRIDKFTIINEIHDSSRILEDFSR